MNLLIIPSLYPQTPSDHTGIFVRDQARALAQRHEVSVLVPRLITLRTLIQGTRLVSHDPSIIQTPQGSLREIDVPILNVSNRLEALTHRLWHRRMVATAMNVLTSGSGHVPDIVHAHFVRPAGGVALSLAKRWNATAVLTEHSGPFSVHLRTASSRRATSAVLRGASRIIAVSPSLSGEIRAAFPDLAPLVIGNVVDDEFFSPGAPELPREPRMPFRFLFVGGLTWHKGVEYLLEACVILDKRKPSGWQVVLVGDGPDRAGLARRTAELGLSERVIFVGNQNREGVRAWMRSSDVMVQPSVIETFCVVLIEAMACGAPVIATDCGGPSWIVRPDGGRLVAARDPSALASAMADALDGQLPREPQMIRRAIVQRFGREAWLREIEKAYAGAAKR